MCLGYTHSVLSECEVAVWIREPSFAPLLWCDVPVEVDHASYVLPASANDYCSRVVLLYAPHKPLVKCLQLFNACHRYSFPVVHKSTVLLQGINTSLQVSAQHKERQQMQKGHTYCT